MESLKKLTLWQRRGLAAAIGGCAGFAYYYYIGCASGTCPITGNPYIATAYGMLMGGLLVDGKKKAAPPSDAASIPQ